MAVEGPGKKVETVNNSRQHNAMKVYRVFIAIVLFSAAAVALLLAEGSPKDPGCEGCAQSALVQKWTSACQKATAQAACYCAAAALVQCNIDHGGCGSDIIELKKMVKQNAANAKALGTSCF
jgi:hypothetical protein